MRSACPPAWRASGASPSQSQSPRHAACCRHPQSCTLQWLMVYPSHSFDVAWELLLGGKHVPGEQPKVEWVLCSSQARGSSPWSGWMGVS